MAMGEGDLHDEIARIEAEIEALNDTLERCRKFALAAKVAMAGGAFGLAAMAFGVLDTGGAALLAAVSAVLGGIVLSGSNAGTAAQAGATLQDAAARRAELIGMIEFRVIEGGRNGVISDARGMRKPWTS
jgi:hypothetical protein